MNATTTPAIAVVPTTANWTVEGLGNQTFPAERAAIQAASAHAIVVKRSIWIRFAGERTRLLRF